MAAAVFDSGNTRIWLPVVGPDGEILARCPPRVMPPRPSDRRARSGSGRSGFGSSGLRLRASDTSGLVDSMALVAPAAAEWQGINREKTT